MKPSEAAMALDLLVSNKPTYITPVFLSQLRNYLELYFKSDTSNNPSLYKGGSHGHCVMVSMLLHKLFDAKFLSTKFEETSHWFSRLTLHDGKLADVDLTGDQFGHDKVRIKSINELYSDAQIRNSREINSETQSRFATFLSRIDVKYIARILNPNNKEE